MARRAHGIQPPNHSKLPSPWGAAALRDRAGCEDSPVPSNWEEQGLRPPPVLGDAEPRNAEPRASMEGRRGPRSMGM